MKAGVRSLLALAGVLTLGLSGVEAKEFLVGVDAPLFGMAPVSGSNFVTPWYVHGFCSAGA